MTEQFPHIGERAQRHDARDDERLTGRFVPTLLMHFGLTVTRVLSIRKTRSAVTVGRDRNIPQADQNLITTHQRQSLILEGMHAMNHLDILASSIARLTAAYQGEQREKTQARLVGALGATDAGCHMRPRYFASTPR
jgi:hypothetical protein